MGAGEAVLLVGGGLVAGIINTLAGGASSLTVPLLVLVGLPGNLANGTNRVGVFLQCLSATRQFRSDGVSGVRDALPLLLPTVLGALVGALLISRVADQTFERLFAVVMVLLLIPLALPGGLGHRTRRAPLPRAAMVAIFFAIGTFGGAFQAGVGLLIVAALSYGGDDLIHANSVKVVINSVLTGSALIVFLYNGQVVWLPASALAFGFILGGAAGARLAVRGGERVIRPVLAVAVLLLAGKMLGIY